MYWSESRSPIKRSTRYRSPESFCRSCTDHCGFFRLVFLQVSHCEIWNLWNHPRLLNVVSRFVGIAGTRHFTLPTIPEIKFPTTYRPHVPTTLPTPRTDHVTNRISTTLPTPYQPHYRPPYQPHTDHATDHVPTPIPTKLLLTTDIPTTLPTPYQTCY